MTKRGPRGLTPEEQALWNKVADRTQAMHPKRSERPKKSLLQPKPAKPEPAAISPFRVGQHQTDTAMPHNLAPSISDSLSAHPVAMDRKKHARLKRGKLQPEARVDLHGMTLDQAHGRLNRFILDAQAQGRRLVLVITGKGKDKFDDGPIPVRRGVLKHHVPGWLNAPVLRHAVLQISEAHLKHGGTGAYYVYLRRRR